MSLQRCQLGFDPFSLRSILRTHTRLGNAAASFGWSSSGIESNEISAEINEEISKEKSFAHTCSCLRCEKKALMASASLAQADTEQKNIGRFFDPYPAALQQGGAVNQMPYRR